MVVETPSPAWRLVVWLGAGLGVRTVAGTGGSWRVLLAEGEIRLVPGPAERVTTVLLDGADAPEAILAGLRYRRAGPRLERAAGDP